jgi:hypothetical protein
MVEHLGDSRRGQSTRGTAELLRGLAADSGIDGDALTGWIAWARIDWPGPERRLLR